MLIATSGDPAAAVAGLVAAAMLPAPQQITMPAQDHVRADQQREVPRRLHT
ncbi:hypothetical protein AB0L65_31740 [Nonomuraea sp. NPDC052116]|uniref:hypothetical protein n=1 Tax=Nonomuraea sp. NPDC052116 TaxID=3155665 RepID=UPI003449E25F